MKSKCLKTDDPMVTNPVTMVTNPVTMVKDSKEEYREIRPKDQPLTLQELQPIENRAGVFQVL